MNEAIGPGGRVEDGKLEGVEGHAAVPVRKGHQAHRRLDVHLDTVPTEPPLGVAQGPLDNPAQGIFRERLEDDDQRPESKGLVPSKEGFPVVAPIRITVPGSTWGRNASLWALF